MKQCNRCQLIKGVNEFFKDKKTSDGLYTICKECKTKSTYEWRNTSRAKYNQSAINWRKNNPEKLYASEIKRRYGCTMHEYNQRLKEQDFKCKICSKEHDQSKKRKRLYVDHCHNSKVIRGLLCAACNSAIGYFKDDPIIMQKAIDYLRST